MPAESAISRIVFASEYSINLLSIDNVGITSILQDLAWLHIPIGLVPYLKEPSFRYSLPRMSDRARCAGGDTGQRRTTGNRLAGCTIIFQLFAMFFFDGGDFIIVVIHDNFKKTHGARANAAMMGTFGTGIGIDGYEIFTAAVQISVIGFHLTPCFCFSTSVLANNAAPRAPAI